jgi:hypothetical protein
VDQNGTLVCVLNDLNYKITENSFQQESGERVTPIQDTVAVKITEGSFCIQ